MKNNLIKKNNIPKKYLNKHHLKRFNKIFLKVRKEIFDNTNNEQSIYNILSENYKFSFTAKELKKFYKFKTIALIGMGGSILGAEAIYKFLKKKIKKKIYFFDDIHDEKIKYFNKNINKNKTLFLIISKSGNTIETLVNSFSLKIIKKNSKNIIVISEKANNILFQITKKFNLHYIEHKKNVGGRYSVLSEVGAVPAILMGLNVNHFRKNLKKNFLKKEMFFLKESTLKLACILRQRKLLNLIFLNYAPELEKFLFWCQQLIAESLGKNGYGFLPTISNAPKDHHSLLQLYLDGPKDKLFYIFNLDKESEIKINSKKYTSSINIIHSKTQNKVKLSQKNALIKSLKKKIIPYRETTVKTLNEETLGELFSYYILETIILGKLVGINPFNQPAVEEVKINTKKILS